MLLNIVKLRYLDPPIFVDVGQIVAGYTLETTVSAGGQFADAGNTASLGGSARFTDRPTITYTPLTGNHFVKALMTPIPPESVFFMIQSGWPAEAVLMASAASLNGLKNQETSITGVAPPDPDFLRALRLLRNLQLSGAVSMRVKQDEKRKQTSILTFRTRNTPPKTLEDMRELRLVLQLDPDAEEFELVFGGTSAHTREIAVITRSIMHIMTTMAAQVEVPQSDIDGTRATPGFQQAGGGDPERLVRIYSSKAKPDHPFVAVPYRDYWFWIEDGDLKTKRAFAFMLMLFTLSDPGQKEAAPLITIPAQ